jgi:hypothetical protein
VLGFLAISLIMLLSNYGGAVRVSMIKP